MVRYNPYRPGECLTALYLEPNGLRARELAVKLDVAASALHRVPKRQSAISPDMALRLSKALGRSPESRPTLQSWYDLWQPSRARN